MIWDNRKNVRQRLFIGDHKDAGGGHLENGLSDIPLKWMVENMEKLGFEFSQDVDEIHPAPLGVLHETWEYPNWKWILSILDIFGDHRQFGDSIEIDESIEERVGKECPYKPCKDNSDKKEYFPTNLIGLYKESKEKLKVKKNK